MLANLSKGIPGQVLGAQPALFECLERKGRDGTEFGAEWTASPSRWLLSQVDN
jgi:hypothetical protein